VADEPPEWSDVDADAVEERVVELAENGHDPSQIGMKLRDEGVQGTPVPDVKLATGRRSPRSSRTTTPVPTSRRTSGT